MAEKYRPSSGSEGASFIDAWCGRCALDANEDCPIVAATLMFDVDAAEYPPEWIVDAAGPRCTAFVDADAPPVTPRCPHTIDMFEASP